MVVAVVAAAEAVLLIVTTKTTTVLAATTAATVNRPLPLQLQGKTSGEMHEVKDARTSLGGLSCACYPISKSDAFC